jgi:hypothetical protein
LPPVPRPFYGAGILRLSPPNKERLSNERGVERGGAGRIG